MFVFIINDPIQGDTYYNAYEKDIAVVNIFFGGSTVFGEEMLLQFIIHTFLSDSSEFERSRRMTWLDFISNLGGLCGLCLGISFVSMIELVYWFLLQFFTRVLR